MHRGRYYVVPVYTEDGELLRADEMEVQFEWIIDHARTARNLPTKAEASIPAV